MFARPLSALKRASLVIAISVAGCATQMPNLGNVASARDAQAAVSIGKSTKADVEAALGKAIVVSFDSGYEVWVYREKGAGGLFARPTRDNAELVLLFEPPGVLRKSRIRDASS
jgi:hypothetical protein